MKLAQNAIAPYTIDVSESILNDLHKRLDITGAVRNRNSTRSRSTGRRSTASAYILCMHAAKDLRHSR